MNLAVSMKRLFIELDMDIKFKIKILSNYHQKEKVKLDSIFLFFHKINHSLR